MLGIYTYTDNILPAASKQGDITIIYYIIEQQLHNKYYLSKLEDDFLLEKRQLKDLAKKINFSQLFLIIRYFVRSIIKKDK